MRFAQGVAVSLLIARGDNTLMDAFQILSILATFLAEKKEIMAKDISAIMKLLSLLAASITLANQLR